MGVALPQPVGGHVIVYGWSLKESTGTAAAELDLIDGTDATGLNLVPITLTAGQSTRDWLGPQGLHFRNGLFPRVASGAIVGSVWIADPPRGRHH